MRGTRRVREYVAKRIVNVVRHRICTISLRIQRTLSTSIPSRLPCPFRQTRTTIVPESRDIGTICVTCAKCQLKKSPECVAFLAVDSTHACYRIPKGAGLAPLIICAWSQGSSMFCRDAPSIALRACERTHSATPKGWLHGTRATNGRNGQQFVSATVSRMS